MPVRVAGQAVSPRGRVRVDEVDGNLEFQMLRRYGSEPETILTLRLQAVSGPPMPSLWIQGPERGIAAGMSWLLVGGPIDSLAILPETDTTLFTLRRGETGLELLAESEHSLQPGLGLSWPGLALRCEPVPSEHEAFLFD